MHCSRGVCPLRRKLVILQTLLLGLREPPRPEVEGAHLPGVRPGRVAYLLSRHLFESRVLIEPLPESSKDLVEAWLVLLGHTPWRVAAGHLAPLEGFMTSAILTAWCRLRSASRGCDLVYLNHEVLRSPHFGSSDHEWGATASLSTARCAVRALPSHNRIRLTHFTLGHLLGL
jgi:hypothetical protein